MTELYILIPAILLGGIVQTCAGFGSALVAMPLFLYVLEKEAAAPVYAMLGLFISGTVFYQNRASISPREALPLIIASVPGIAVGVYLLQTADGTVIKRVLGVILIAYALWMMLRRDRPASTRTSREGSAGAGMLAIAGVAGFLSGVLGGAFNTSGPPLLLYASIRGWPKEQFRSILQTVYIVGGALTVAGHTAGGLVNGRTVTLAACSLPGLVLGLWIGRRIDRRISQEQFVRMTLALILLLGGWLLVP